MTTAEGKPSNMLTRDPPTPRPPAPGELQIAVLLGADAFFGWVPGHDVDGVLDAFEARFAVPADARTDVGRHMALRVAVAARLRGARDGCDFGDALAAACTWLALRHPSQGATLRAGVDACLPAGAVLTCAIGEAPGALRDTAWAFMVGTGIHDGRNLLAATPVETVAALDDAARRGVPDWTPPANASVSEWTPPKA